MTPRCLICDSKVVLSKEAANAAVLLIGTVDSFLLGVRQVHTQGVEIAPDTRPESLLVQLLDLIGESVSSATSGYTAMTAVARDVQKYQFGHYDYLCLRCGARFDQETSTESFAPSTIIPSSSAQPNAQSAPRPSAGPHDPAALTID